MKIMVLDFKTREIHAALSDLGGHSSFSPDGRMLVADAFWDQTNNKKSLYVLSAAGSSKKELNLGKSLPQKS